MSAGGGLSRVCRRGKASCSSIRREIAPVCTMAFRTSFTSSIRAACAPARNLCHRRFERIVQEQPLPRTRRICRVARSEDNRAGIDARRRVVGVRLGLRRDRLCRPSGIRSCAGRSRRHDRGMRHERGAGAPYRSRSGPAGCRRRAGTIPTASPPQASSSAFSPDIGRIDRRLGVTLEPTKNIAVRVGPAGPKIDAKSVVAHGTRVASRRSVYAF